MRGRNSWTCSEIEKLIEEYNAPIQELEKMFPRHNKESLRRKINDLRKLGKIGMKTSDVIEESYRLRHVKSK